MLILKDYHEATQFGSYCFSNVVWHGNYGTKVFPLKSTLLMRYVRKERIKVEKCGLHKGSTEIETMILLHTYIFLPTDIEF